MKDFKSSEWKSEKRLTYLVGAIECLSDEGMGWRRETELLLKEIGWDCIIPNQKELMLKKNFEFDTLKERNFQLYCRIMQKIIKQDIGFVDAADCLIFRWEGEMTYGTSHEIGHAFLTSTPVILWTESKTEQDVPGWWCGCKTTIVYSWPEVVEELKFIELEKRLQ